MNDSKAERRFISVRRQEEVFTWKSTIRQELKIIYTFSKTNFSFRVFDLWWKGITRLEKSTFSRRFLAQLKSWQSIVFWSQKVYRNDYFSALKHRYSFLSSFWNCNRPQSVIHWSLIQVELIMEKGKHLLLLHWFKSRLLRKQKLEVVCGKAISSTACSALSFRLRFLFHIYQHLHWKASLVSNWSIHQNLIG